LLDSLEFVELALSIEFDLRGSECMAASSPGGADRTFIIGLDVGEDLIGLGGGRVSGLLNAPTAFLTALKFAPFKNGMI
jgi:hypothetical protein